jgi:predicted nuclease of predicted toxin-antitoxin system
MARYLVDANLSPKVAEYLSDQRGHDAISLIVIGRQHIPDSEVVAMAIAEKRIIVTLDNGFGETYFKREPGQFGVMLMRLGDQATVAVIAALDRFFNQELDPEVHARSLVILSESTIRIRRH